MENKILVKTAKVISHPISQLIIQTAMAVSCNPEIIKYSNSIGIVQAEFSTFVNSLISEIQSNKTINLEKINQREVYYFISNVLKEVYFEESNEKRNKYRNLILSSIESTNFDNNLSKEHLITLTQISEKEMVILKQSMTLKSDKNGFNNEFDYWEVFNQFEKRKIFSKEEYQGYINHLIGLGLMNHSQMSLVGGDKSVFSVTQKGISFFDYIKLGK